MSKLFAKYDLVANTPLMLVQVDDFNSVNIDSLYIPNPNITEGSFSLWIQKTGDSPVAKDYIFPEGQPLMPLQSNPIYAEYTSFEILPGQELWIETPDSNITVQVHTA